MKGHCMKITLIALALATLAGTASTAVAENKAATGGTANQKAAVGNGSVQKAAKPSTASPTKVDPAQFKTTATGLKYAILKPGAGDEAKQGLIVTVHYTGWLESTGEKFDSSADRDQPFFFQIGEGRVIKGWEEGVTGMKKGEKRQLVIPAALGYGAKGAGGKIPPNATLVFDIELLRVDKE